MNAQQLHARALEIAGRYRRSESEMIAILQELDNHKTYRDFKYTSLYDYSVSELKLSRDVACVFINVARKAKEVPALKHAIDQGEITVSNAKKITSVLTPENQEKWIEMAKRLPQQKLEREVARVNPKMATPEKAKYVTENRLRLTLGVSEEVMEDLKRAQDLVSQSTQKAADLEATLGDILAFYLKHKDPLKKQSRTKKVESVVLRLQKPEKSGQRMAVALKRQVLKRDHGQCTEILRDGSRCHSHRWLDIHHVIPRSKSGQDTPENLTTLCRAHHMLRHAGQNPSVSGDSWRAENPFTNRRSLAKIGT